MSRRSRQLALVFAAELAALTTTATGQAFQPAGDELQANTYKRYNQSDPRVAALPDGAFVIVLESGSVDCMQDSDVSGVFAQRSTNTLCGKKDIRRISHRGSRHSSRGQVLSKLWAEKPAL